MELSGFFRDINYRYLKMAPTATAQIKLYLLDNAFPVCLAKIMFQPVEANSCKCRPSLVVNFFPCCLYLKNGRQQPQCVFLVFLRHPVLEIFANFLRVFLLLNLTSVKKSLYPRQSHPFCGCAEPAPACLGLGHLV